MKRIAIRNRMESTMPMVIHANGLRDSRVFQFIKDQFFSTAGKFSPTSDHAQQQSWVEKLTVLTWNNTGEPGLFEQSCKVLGVPYKTIRADIKDTRPNTRITYPLKIEATVEVLPQIKTEYVMLVDSFDALLLDSPAKIMDCYLANFSGGVVFGAERGHFPAEVKTRDREKAMSGGKDNPFMNSGFCLGKTADVLSVYKLAKETGDGWNFNECMLTDQAAIKTVYARTCEIPIDIDQSCRMCQNLFAVQAGELELMYVDNGLRLEIV